MKGHHILPRGGETPEELAAIATRALAARLLAQLKVEREAQQRQSSFLRRHKARQADRARRLAAGGLALMGE